MLRYADLRLDGSSLKELPDGSIKVTGQLTHPGIFEYRNPDGSLRREYRPAEEVFKKAAMETFAGATITVGHPRQPNGSRLVNANSWKKDAVGHLGENVREDGGHVVADLYIRDAQTVAAVKAGRMKHLSCGYDVDYDPTPGTTPDGQRHDGVQRNIRGNHVALLPNGMPPRGGEECVLRLDSNGDELKSVVDIEALQAKVTALEAELAKARTDAAEVPALRVQLTQANTKTAELGEQLSPARLDALCDTRVAVVSAAKSEGIALVDEKRVAKSNLALKREIVAKRTPDLATRADSMGEDSLDAVLAVYKSQPHPSMAVLGTDAAKPADKTPATGREDAAVPKISDLQAKSQTASINAWKNAGDKPGKVN